MIPESPEALRAQIASLEQLLQVFEETTRVQSDRLRASEEDLRAQVRRQEALLAVGEAVQRLQAPEGMIDVAVVCLGALAEDHPVNRRLAVRTLEKRGCRVTLAGTGREAVAALSRAAFDVVLMDLEMPDIGGMEATAAIRAMEASAGGKTPIIALTAHAMKGDRERCLESGMDGYVSKPLTAEDLFAEMDRLTPPARSGGRDTSAIPTFAVPEPSPCDRGQGGNR